MSVALALLLTAVPAPPAKQASDSARLEALALDPSTLPKAAQGRWSQWNPKDPLPEALAGAMQLALVAYQAADYPRALELLPPILRREPDFPPALYQLGLVYFRLRRYGDGARTFERFVAVAPHELGATQALGHCYYTLGDYARAQAHYEKVLALAPRSSEAWRGLGLAHLRQGAAERALEALDRCLELRPGHADALLWRAQALFELERPGEALLAVTTGLEGAPHEPRGWFLLAQVQSELGRDEEAKLSRARFAELSRIEQEVRAQEGLLLYEPRAVEPLRRLVMLHGASRNTREALELLSRLLEAAPDDLGARVLALETCAELAPGPTAERMAAELEARFPREEGAWSALETYCRRLGDAARAERARLKRAELGATR